MVVGDLLFLSAALAIVAAIVLGSMGGHRLWKQHVAEMRAARSDQATSMRQPEPSNDTGRSEPAVVDKKKAAAARR